MLPLPEPDRPALRLPQPVERPGRLPDLDRRPEEQRFGFEIYGAGASVSADSADLLERVRSRLPPIWTPLAPQPGDPHFQIRTRGPDRYTLSSEDFPPGDGTPEFILKLLDVQLRTHIARSSPTKFILHAGAVGVEDRAVVIPGVSTSGKSELVAEFVRSGASYLSDECAVLDAEGMVHPFVKPLSLRTGARTQRECDVGTLGGRIAAGPLPVRLIVLSQFQAGARWRPERLSPAEAVLALMSHAVQSLVRPAGTMSALRRAVENSIVLQGVRGEAAEVVPLLIDTLAADQH